MFTFEELDSNTKIDKNNLDEMCVQHGELFKHVSMGLIKATSERDRAKRDCEKTYNTLDMEERKAFKEAKEKFTETQLKCLIEINTDYDDAYGYFLDCKYECGRWEALKQSYLERSERLKQLCQLYLNNYYGDISVKEVSNDAKEVEYKNSKVKTLKKLANRRRQD